MNTNEQIPWSLAFSDEELAARRRRYARDFALTPLTNSTHLLASDERHAVYYVPVDVSPSPQTLVIFVGLTPGLAQMELAAKAFMEGTDEQRGDDRAFANLLRSRVAFAGSMRSNLCTMLDHLIGDDDLRKTFDVATSEDLFDPTRTDVATTSALVFPVFTYPALKNFSGGCIDLSSKPLFRTMIDTLLKPRLIAAPTALIIPFGKVASTGIAYLCDAKHIDRARVLWGMPHPSGANGHRVRIFNENAECMREQLTRFYNRQTAS